MNSNESFVLGMLIGAIVVSTPILFVNQSPVETPMQTHCVTFNSDLKSYDAWEFECTNGATFNRGDN